MATEVSEYSALARLTDLGLKLPLVPTFLPSNLADVESSDKLVVRGEATTLRKVLRQGGVEVAILEGPNALIGFVHNKSHDWAMPALLFTAEAIRTNPDLVSVVVDLVKAYVTDMFKGLWRDKQIKAEIVVETRKAGTFQKITYEGGPEGLSMLAAMVRDIHGQS